MDDLKHRLIAGTINRYAPEDGWRNWHMDVSERPIWSAELAMSVRPEFVMDLGSPEVQAAFRPGMFDEIRSHHVLEHMSWPQAGLAVANARYLLKQSGIFDVEVPAVDKCIDAYAAGELSLEGLQQWLYGEELPEHQPGDSHRTAFTVSRLRGLLADNGFVPGDEIEAGYAARFRAVRR